MNEKGREKNGEKKLMAQENPLYYTCFRGFITMGSEHGHEHTHTCKISPILNFLPNL